MTKKREVLLSASESTSKVSYAQPTSLYAQLKTRLEARILSGEFPVGSKFPTEHEICEEYQVSRVTTRKALKLMEQEGLLARIRSRGSFVKQIPQPAPSYPVDSTPYQPRQVEIRCMLPMPIPALWQSPWFQQKFKQQFPDVRLTFIEDRSDIPYDKRYNGLDLYSISPPLYQHLKARGLLESWSEILGETHWKNLLADIPSDLIRYVGYDKIDHLIPLVYSPVAFIYNKQLFKESGVPPPRFNWSEEEFFSVCESLHQHTHSRRRFFPFFCDFSSHFRWPFALYREGGSIWDPSGTTCTLDSEASLRGIHFYQKMIIEKGWGRPHHGNLPGSDYTLFSRGHVAIQLGSAYTISKLTEHGCDDWGILAVPEGHKRANISTNCLLAVSPHVRDRELIAEFIEFIRQPDILREQFRHWKMFNTSQRALNEILQDTSQEEREFISSFLRLTPEINNIEYPASITANTKLTELIQLLWIDLEHAETHCREIAAEINSMPELLELRKSLQNDTEKRTGL